MRPSPDAPYSEIREYERQRYEYGDGARTRRLREMGESYRIMKGLDTDSEDNTVSPHYRNKSRTWHDGYSGIIRMDLL